MKARLEQKDYSHYLKKRNPFDELFKHVKWQVELYKITKEFYPEKTDEELIQEFKENHPDLELEENQEIAVNNLYWTRIAQVCITHKSWNKTFIWGFSDKYIENLEKYSSN